MTSRHVTSRLCCFAQVSVTFGDVTRYDAQMNLDEEETMLMKYREERQHGAFPDEVDTPQDTSARIRSQKQVTPSSAPLPSPPLPSP